MAQTAFSIRMDDALKRDFSQFCENIGMTMSTAFVVFAKAALRLTLRRSARLRSRSFGMNIRTWTDRKGRALFGRFWRQTRNR